MRIAYASAFGLRDGVKSFDKAQTTVPHCGISTKKAKDALLGERIMSKRLRLVLGTAGAIALAIVWGIVATSMGVPSILITVGAVAIGAGIYSYLDQSRS
ncbi:hypothetical protein NKI56_28890 [Mesorhizobium sp. M0622]|uniref:hypothetical protein n=1 Tax=unclassified Mesorhizobium TaxID=325217 RepID=UPI00333CBBB3